MKVLVVRNMVDSFIFFPADPPLLFDGVQSELGQDRDGYPTVVNVEDKTDRPGLDRPPDDPSGRKSVPVKSQ